MEKVNDFEFDPGYPKQLNEVVVTNEEFEKIEEKVDLDENVRFGDRGWDAPPGKVKIWVRKDDEEED
ncbi:MAG: hypothetical protein H8Z69_03285 [Nanohaloarchaea archaeon]|nr:hypothetical protein [Candidatus Nanohaloarchaea archaeon]